MTTPHVLTTDFALLIHVLGHVPGKDPTVRAVTDRVLQGIAETGLSMAAEVRTLWANGVAIHPDSPGAILLSDTMLIHHVGVVEFPRDCGEVPVLAVARALAAPAGSYASFASFAGSLGGTITSQVMLRESGTDLVIHNLATDDPIQLESAGTAEEDGIFSHGGETTIGPIGDFDLIHGASALVEADTAPARQELARLVERAAVARDTEQWDDLLTAGLGIEELLVSAATPGFQRTCRIELQRLVSGEALTRIARATGTGTRRREATTLLRHVGRRATEVLMEMLAAADGMAERRGYYTALTQMQERENAGIIIDYLSHPVWYVARNAADLCGDMDLVESIPELAKRIYHEDERVRRSVAGALAKLGTSQAMEPIRQMLRDPAAPVRLEALMHLDGRRRGRSIGMVLAALLERETHTDVRREMLRTLGRIGTPDTIQAILRAAQPEGKRFRGRPRNERLGAVGALALAGPAAVPALRTLVKDPDPEVARAAEEAVAMINEQ